MKSPFSILLCLLLSLLLFGCVGMQTTTQSSPEKITYHLDGKSSQGISWPDEQLIGEFEKYWRLRLAGQSESTWAMEAPYFKELTSEKKYDAYIESYTGGELTGIEIWNIERETNNLVIIRCEITYEKNAKSAKFFIGDRWVKVRNKWYHIVHDPILFPSAQ